MTMFVVLDQSAGLGFVEAVTPKDFTAQVMSVSIRRGRNRLLNSYEAGQATITIKDDNGYFNPQNTSSPYYPIAPMNKIRISLNNYQTGIFTGYVTSIKTEFARGQEDYNKVILVCHDLLRFMNQVQISTVTGAGSVQNSGTRIGKLLDMISYPTGASYRDIRTGNFDVQADPATSRNLLDAIRTVQDSENGAFFIDGNGIAKFYNQNLLATLSGTSYRFGDTDIENLGLPVQVGFSDAKVNFDDDLLFNSISVTRTGGTTQTATSSTSITKYGQRNASRSNTLNTSDTDTLYIAKNLRNTLEDSEIRIDEILIPYHAKSALVKSSLRNMDLYSVKNVWKIMADGSTIKKLYTVAGIQWDITKDQYWVRYLIQEPLVRLFVLNDTELGQLDYNGLGV